MPSNLNPVDDPRLGWARWWRVMLVASGVLALLGGPMHPDSDAEDSLSEELAVMTADEAWVPGHTLLLVATVLLAAGLWGAHLSRRWPARAGGALRLAAVAVSVYVVEAAFHLGAVVDSDRLADGEFAPIAYAHIALAAVLYPASGLAIAYLAWKVAPAWSLPQRALAAAGVIGGVVHALSIPTTLVFQDVETSPMFGLSGTMIAFWTIGAGLVGIRSWSTTEEREAELVA